MPRTESIWDGFTNQYSLSKTLRFELKPIGKTQEYIKERGLITEDKEREKNFDVVKNMMDDYYRHFIEESLVNVAINTNHLKRYQEIYNSLKKDRTNQKLQKEFSQAQGYLRKQILKGINENPNFQHLFKQEFLTKILPTWLGDKDRTEDAKRVLEFNKWSTYFTGFFDNRKNVFSEKEIPTSVIYRIVNDNLPKFLDDISRFEELKKLNGFDYSEVESNLKQELEGKCLNDVFSLDNFNNCLNQSGIDLFNLIIGGKSDEGGTHFKGLNNIINEFSQQQDNKAIRRLKLIPLFKQILSDRESFSFISEKFDNDKELMEELLDFYEKIRSIQIIDKLKDITLKLPEYDLERVYLKNDANLTQISQEIFDNWAYITSALQEYAVSVLGLKESKAKAWVQKQSYFSIYELEEAIRQKSKDAAKNPICTYLSRFDKGERNLFEKMENNSKPLFDITVSDDRKLLTRSREADMETIKAFLDSILGILHFVKPLHLEPKKKSEEGLQDAFETDPDFYLEFNAAYDALNKISPLYDKVRNYITQKPFSTKKFKLNFQNSTLLAGWDKNKERDNWSVIFRKDGLYYLGIMSSEDNKIFSKTMPNLKDCSDYFEKMNYKLLPGPNKMLPKVIFSKKNIAFFNPSKEILSIRDHASYTKGGTPQTDFDKKEFDLDDCHQMIDFYKTCLEKHPEWCEYGFRFKATDDYADISEFYNDIANQGYRIFFEKIDSDYITKLVDDGKLYLFKIWNKDFSKFSKGKKNLHTIYWEELFSEKNLSDVVYKLNGEAELFYREASLEGCITHPKNEPIQNKDPIKGKKTSTFPYNLIKDKRYSKDKFLFHCPMTLNFKAGDKNWETNKKVNEHVAKNCDDICILGIDRGERNLASYVLIDSKGKIISQSSLNVTSDDFERTRDYQNKLDTLEGSRNEARKNWKKIANIKELKEGYLSQVVHQISNIAIDNNAIIALEDLNFGFKRGRFKIEKQVYEKFEKKLIDKLNYLVFKDRLEDEIGGALHAYQLTKKFESFKVLGKQSGILYYVPASYTSKIDPATGFVNLLYPRFENIEKAKAFFKKFDSIKFNSSKDYFEFSFRYSNFIEDMEKDAIIKDDWTVCSVGNRLVNKRLEKSRGYETIEKDLTEELKSLFSKNQIEFEEGNDLIEAISSQDNAEFFKNLIYLLKCTLQLRNSRTGTNEDYILSCVKDKNGRFFDSREANDNEPKDADANGAYNIALKGLMLVERLKNSDLESKKLDLRIDRNEFLNFVMKRAL